MTTLHPRARGFSLIEALIAITVFMVGVLGFMGAIVSARGSTAWARRDMGATAVAEDLTAQIGLWAYDDPRLTTSTGSPCFTDPADTAEALTKPGTGAFTGFVACAHQEADLGYNATPSSNKYWGLPTATFPVTTNNVGVVQDSDQFTRLYVVREEDEQFNPSNPAPSQWSTSVAAMTNSGCRKRIWVLVAYRDGGIGRRVVTYQTKYNPACTAR